MRVNGSWRRNNLEAEIEKNKKRLDNAQKMMLDREMDRAEYIEIKNLIEPKIEEVLNQQIGTSQIEMEYILKRIKCNSKFGAFLQLCGCCRKTIYHPFDLERKCSVFRRESSNDQTK